MVSVLSHKKAAQYHALLSRDALFSVIRSTTMSCLCDLQNVWRWGLAHFLAVLGHRYHLDPNLVHKLPRLQWIWYICSGSQDKLVCFDASRSLMAIICAHTTVFVPHSYERLQVKQLFWGAVAPAFHVHLSYQLDAFLTFTFNFLSLLLCSTLSFLILSTPHYIYVYSYISIPVESTTEMDSP